MSRFADTSYFLALLIPNDPNHVKAVSLAAQWRGSIVTSDWILIETRQSFVAAAIPSGFREIFICDFARFSDDNYSSISSNDGAWSTAISVAT